MSRDLHINYHGISRDFVLFKAWGQEELHVGSHGVTAVQLDLETTDLRHRGLLQQVLQAREVVQLEQNLRARN